MAKKRRKDKGGKIPSRTPNIPGAGGSSLKSLSPLKIGWTKASLVFALLSGLQLIYSYNPKVSLEPSELIDSTTPASGPFVVHNQSMFSVYNVEVSVGDTAFERDDGRPFQFISGVELQGNDLPIRELRADERSPVSTSEILNTSSPGPGTDMKLFVRYRPSFWPFRVKKEFRFVTVRKESGDYYWQRKALNH